MNTRLYTGSLLLALAVATASAQSRMQVSAPSIAIHAQASAASRPIGTARSGEILFVNRTEGDWAAIAPPAHLDLWLNKDFIEGNRVIAKSIQVRSGPGIQHEVVGTLERGALVMPRGEEGEWCKIEPPSSMVVWVKTSGLAEIKPQTAPIREVAPMPAPAPVPAAPSAPAPLAAIPEPTPAPVTKIAPSTPGATPPPAVPAPTPAPAVAAVAPARPVQEIQTPVAAPAAAPAKPAASKPATKPRPAPVPPAPTLHPATSLKAQSAAQPAAPVRKPAAPAAPRRTPMPAVTKAIPATAATVAAQKPRDVEVEIDQALVDELSLTDEPGQGKSVQVEGELRNAPFLAASPSRYRLQDEDEDGNLEFICHIHGDPNLLRGYVGQNVAIRGREYWVEESDMPVVVVGQIVPLAPTDEPVMY